ncbi:MAG: DnaJ domain-containing protein [Polyangia bacterium]|nr:DnaJ domain-containing protein [Polyangia bacterium]
MPTRGPQSHYLVLGIPRDADPAAVRSAFRALAQVHHPDRAGPGATARFQRMVEAYDVLSDPDRRSEYDRKCQEQCASNAQHNAPWVSPFSQGREGWSGAPRRPAVEPLDDPWPPRRGFAGEASWSEAQPEPVGVLPLAFWEARRGGSFAVAFPFLRTCQSCDGWGKASPGICSVCGGSGRVQDAWRLTLHLPPRLLDGDQLRCRAPWPDGRLHDLIIQVRVV